MSIQTKAIFSILFIFTTFYVSDGMGQTDTEIIKAAKSGKLDKIKNLVIQEGASVNSQGKDNRTALMWAAERGHKHIVIFLLEYGADLTIKDNEGETAFDKATKKQQNHIMEAIDFYKLGKRTNIDNNERYCKLLIDNIYKRNAHNMKTMRSENLSISYRIHYNTARQVYFGNYEDAIALVDVFNKKYPSSDYQKNTTQILDSLYYQKAIKTRLSFQEYLDNYPNGIFNEKVREWIEYSKAIGDSTYSITEDFFYAKSVEANDIDSINLYLKRYPSGKYKNQANKVLKYLQMQSLILDIKYYDVLIAEEAIDSLICIGDSRIELKLIEILDYEYSKKGSFNSRKTELIIKALGELGQDGALHYLTSINEDTYYKFWADNTIMEEIAIALGKIADKRATSYLSNLLVYQKRRGTGASVNHNAALSLLIINNEKQDTKAAEEYINGLDENGLTCLQQLIFTKISHPRYELHPKIAHCELVRKNKLLYQQRLNYVYQKLFPDQNTEFIESEKLFLDFVINDCDTSMAQKYFKAFPNGRNNNLIIFHLWCSNDSSKNIFATDMVRKIIDKQKLQTNGLQFILYDSLAYVTFEKSGMDPVPIFFKLFYLLPDSQDKLELNMINSANLFLFDAPFDEAANFENITTNIPGRLKFLTDHFVSFKNILSSKGIRIDEKERQRYLFLFQILNYDLKDAYGYSKMALDVIAIDTVTLNRVYYKKVVVPRFQPLSNDIDQVNNFFIRDIQKDFLN